MQTVETVPALSGSKQAGFQQAEVQQSGFQQSDLKVYASVLIHWAWFWILMAVVGGLTAYGVSIMSTPIYQASSTLLINQANNPSTMQYQDILSSERVARTYAELMTRRTTQQQVMLRTGITEIQFEEMITSINVSPLRDTQLVRVVVEGTEPALVAEVADALPAVFISEISQLQTERFAESKPIYRRRWQRSTRRLRIRRRCSMTSRNR